MGSVYDGKRFSRKALHNSVDKFSKERSKVADDSQLGAEVTEITVNTSILRVRSTGKAMGQVYQCRWRGYVEKYMFFPRFEY
jgi:hypothetical protein